MMDTRSLTLNGIKREKNFTAVLDKGYQRYVNEDWPISNRDDPWRSLIGFVKREVEELEVEVDILEAHLRTRLRGFSFPDDETVKEQTRKAMREAGDVSNTLDYLFDALDRLERTGEYLAFTKKEAPEDG